MITYNKILVCLDLSDVDESIVLNACEIAKVSGTNEVTFLNVIRDFNLPDSIGKEFPDLIDKAIDERKKHLQQLIDDLFRCDIKTNLMIKQGNATKSILTTSVDVGADLIVLGRKKSSDSVLSTRIIRRAACNILLVPENTRLTLERILVPVDFSVYSLLSLETALSLSSGQNSEIVLQNVYAVPNSFRYSGKSHKEFATIMKENSFKELQALLKQAQIGNQQIEAIHTLDNKQNIIKKIFEEAATRKIDLIVMGAKGRTAASALFIGSKAERMIQVNHTIPLIVVRKKGANAGILESLQDI